MTNANETWRTELESYVHEWEAEGRPSLNDHPYAARLLELCRHFESGIGRWPEAQEPWSPTSLAQRAFLMPSSPAAQLQAAFVLRIWNTDFPCLAADVVAMAASMDASSREAVARWLNQPWFP